MTMTQAPRANGFIFIRNGVPEPENNEYFRYMGETFMARFWYPGLGEVSIYKEMDDYLGSFTD